MTDIDKIVLGALASDLRATIKLRETAYKLASTEEWHPADSPPQEFFRREYVAIEEFIFDHFAGVGNRFCPSI